MANRSGAIGTRAETAVVRAAQPRGFPHADRLRLSGNDDRGDVRLTTTLTAGVIVEVKGGEFARTASENQVQKWLLEAARERDNAGADIGFAVLQRRGVGAANAQRWWAYFDMSTLRAVLLEIERPNLHDGTSAHEWPAEDLGPLDWPVRMTLEEALHLLRLAGWGSPVEEAIEPFAIRN